MINGYGEVLIIGGGTTGCGIAWSLARAGFKVRLLERNRLASGASGASPGIVRQYYADTVLSVLAANGLQTYRQWNEIVGGDCGYTPTGFLSAVSTADWEHAVKQIESLRALGVQLDLISAREIQEGIPDINLNGLAGAVYEQSAGYCDAIATAKSLAQAAIHHGATIEEFRTVHRILARNGQVEGVETDAGLIRGDLIVNAAGPWAAALSRSCQAPLPITASRQCVAIIQLQNDENGKRIPGYSDRECGFYLRPAAANQYMIGSLLQQDSSPADPDQLDRNMSESAIRRFVARAETRFGRFASSSPADSHVSFFDDTPDGNPIIGADPRVAGLFVAAGLSGHGFKFAPVFGLAILEAITTRNYIKSMGVFAIERFLK